MLKSGSKCIPEMLSRCGLGAVRVVRRNARDDRRVFVDRLGATARCCQRASRQQDNGKPQVFQRAD